MTLSVLRFDVRTMADSRDTPDETPYVSIEAAMEHYREAIEVMWDVELVAVMIGGQTVLLACKGG